MPSINLGDKMKNLLVLAMVLMLSSCSTMKDTVAAKGSGTKMTVLKSFDEVWDGIKDIIAISELGIKSEKKEDGIILATQDMTMLSYGQHVAIFVKKISKTKTEIEIVSKSKVATDLFSTNWEKELVKDINSKFN